MGSGFLNFSQLCVRDGDSIPRRFQAPVRGVTVPAPKDLDSLDALAAQTFP